MWAVEKFDKYLLGLPFMLHTDQQALRHVLGSPMQVASKWKMSKFICWAERLSAYDFTLAYRPGKENYVPDMLSGLPLPSKGPALEDNLVACLVRQIWPQGIDFSEIQEQTGLDNDLLMVSRFTQSGWPHKAKIPQNLLQFYHVRDELEWSEEVLL